MCLQSYIDFESRAASRITNHIASHKSQITFWKSNFDSLTLTFKIWREILRGKDFNFLEKWNVFPFHLLPRVKELNKVITFILLFLKSIKINGKCFSIFGKYISKVLDTFSLNLNHKISSLSFYLAHAQRQWTALFWAWMMMVFGQVLWQDCQVLAHRELYEGVRETHPRAGNRLTKIGARNLGFLNSLFRLNRSM